MLLKVFFFWSPLENWAAPEVGDVVPETKCTLDWTILILGVLVSMMFRTTFNAARDVIAVALSMAKRLAFIEFWKAMALFMEFFDNQFGIKQRLNIVNVLIIFVRVDLHK